MPHLGELACRWVSVLYAGRRAGHQVLTGVVLGAVGGHDDASALCGRDAEVNFGLLESHAVLHAFVVVPARGWRRNTADGTRVRRTRR